MEKGNTYLANLVYKRLFTWSLNKSDEDTEEEDSVQL